MNRQSVVLLILGAVFVASVLDRIDVSVAQQKKPGSGKPTPVNFKDSIAPMLRENCTPCHYKGGKVFDRLPFEKFETVRKLGKKLNTRLKDEKAEMVTRWIEGGFRRDGGE